MHLQVATDNQLECIGSSPRCAESPVLGGAGVDRTGSSVQQGSAASSRRNPTDDGNGGHHGGSRGVFHRRCPTTSTCKSWMRSN